MNERVEETWQHDSEILAVSASTKQFVYLRFFDHVGVTNKISMSFGSHLAINADTASTLAALCLTSHSNVLKIK